MDATSFYRTVERQLCQGDIFDFLPHIFQKELPQSLRQITIGKDKFAYELDPLPIGTFHSMLEAGVLVPATCHLCRAMLLTHDCEIDKDKKHRSIAMVRVLPSEMPESDRTTIRQNKRFPFFHLPAHPDFPECYVDFRRTCTIAPEWADSMTRIASLSAAAKQAMLLQLFRFLTRVELDPTVFAANQ